MSRRITLLTALPILALVLACGSSATGGNATRIVPAAQATSAPAVESEATAAPEAAATAPPEPAPSLAKIGDRVEAGGIALTVSSVERKAELSEFQKAGEGKTFVVADVTVENINQDKAPYNVFYFKVKDGEGFEYTAALNTDSQAMKSGDLAKGDKVRGTVAFEVGANAKGLVLQYAPITFGDAPTIRIALD